MKGIYKSITEKNLTTDKEYFLFEIYVNIRNNTKSLRLIDDVGVPILRSTDNFEFNKLEIDNMSALFYENGMTITLRELAAVCKDCSINSLWERYFLNEKEIVDVVNEIINKYAIKENISIVGPCPYGI